MCLLITWNYWMPLFLWSTPFTSLYGGPSSDFYTFQQAGKAWVNHGNPYNLTGQASGFIYPPPSLPFYGLFASFDFRTASQIWFTVYFSIFLVAMLVLGLTLEKERRYLYIPLAALLLLTSYPLLVLMQWGQSDLLVISFVILGLAAERSNHRIASAILVSIATLLKGPAILLLVYFVIFRRDAIYLRNFLTCLALIILASLAIVPISTYGYYVTKVIPAIPFTFNPGAQSTARFLLLGVLQIAPIISLLGVCLFAYFAYWVSMKNSRTTKLEALAADGMFLLSVLVMLLLNLRSGYYQYVAVILPLALFLSALLLTENVKNEYILWVGISIFLLNSVVRPDFLKSQLFPFETMGNVLLVLCIVLIYLRPAAILHLRTR